MGMVALMSIFIAPPQVAQAQVNPWQQPPWYNPYYGGWGWPYYSFSGMGMSVGGTISGNGKYVNLNQFGAFVSDPWLMWSVGPWGNYMSYYNPWMLGGFGGIGGYPYYGPFVYSGVGAQSYGNTSYSGVGVGLTYQKTTKNSSLSLNFTGGSYSSNFAGSLSGFGYSPINPYGGFK
jgi:hypothetical protein